MLCWRTLHLTSWRDVTNSSLFSFKKESVRIRDEEFVQVMMSTYSVAITIRYRYLRLCLKKILLVLLVHRDQVLAGLNFGAMFFSLATLVRLEKWAKEADAALQKCEALLVEKSVEIPVVAEKSVANSIVIPATITVVVVFVVLFFCFVFTRGENPGNPPERTWDPEMTYFTNPLFRPGVVTNFREKTLDVPAMLVKHAEGDFSLYLHNKVSDRYMNVGSTVRDLQASPPPPTVLEALTVPELVTTALENMTAL